MVSVSLHPAPLSTEPRYCHSHRLKSSYRRGKVLPRDIQIFFASNCSSDRCLLAILFEEIRDQDEAPIQNFKWLFKGAKDVLTLVVLYGRRSVLHSLTSEPQQQVLLANNQNGSKWMKEEALLRKRSLPIFRCTLIDM